MAGYTRQSLAEIQNGEDIVAGPLNDEFDALQTAFNATTGHAHDGTAGSGPKISLTGSVSGTLPVANGGTGITTTTAFAQTLLDDADATAARATLGAVIGTNVQAYDAGLASIAGLTTAADTMIYTTALDAYATTALTPFARTVLDDTTAANFLTTLGVSAFVQTILNDADAGTVRTTIGLGTAATQNTGTSGATVPLLNGVNTWSGDQTISNTSPELHFIDTDTNADGTISGSSGVGSLFINVDSTSVGSAPVLNLQVRGSNKLALSQTSATFSVPVTIAADEDITFAAGDGGLMWGTEGNFYFDDVNLEWVFLTGGISSNSTLIAGAVTLTGLVEADQIQLNSTTDVTLASTGHALQLGPTAGTNLAMDGNEIQARNNGAAATLTLQQAGGTTLVGGQISALAGIELDGTESVWSEVFAGSTPVFSSSTAAGFFLSGGGVISCSRSAADALRLQRTTSDGAVATFSRQTTAVGSISLTAAATAYNTSSDIRLKQDFQPINPALLDAIKVYDFEWKIDGSRAYGVIAQELDEVIPQAVHKGDSEDDMWSVDYSKLVPLLIAKVQDLEARLKVLEGK